MNTPGFTPGLPLSAGQQYWRVRASNNCGDGPWSSGNFVVDTLPTAPILIVPANASHTCGTSPFLDWSTVTGATLYRVQVDDSPSFSSPVVNADVSVSNRGIGPLTPGTYHWRVRASNNCGDSAWSNVWSFVTDAVPAAPPLGAPANGSRTCDDTPAFEWGAVAGAASYRIQVDDNPSFGDPEINTTTTTDHFVPTTPLPAVTLHWRVRAINDCGPGPWSPSRSFSIDAAPPAPTLTSPADAGHTCHRTFEFNWRIAGRATSYRIQVDNDPAFGSPEVNATTVSEEPVYILTSPLAPGAYHWRVRGLSDCGPGPWSAQWSFVIDATPGTPSGPSPANGATGVALNANLDWADADGAASYDVYFGTATTPPKVGNVRTSTYTLTMLTADVRYHWKIVARNACGEKAGPVWSFTTGTGGTNRPPTNGTITPNSGGAPAGQIVYFASSWSDPDGQTDLKACRLHIGRWAAPKSLIGNAVVLYQARTNKLLIRNDRGTRWWGGRLVGSDNVIQNSQVKVYCKRTTVTRAASTIQVRWALEFKPAFRGRTKMHLKARDLGGLTSPLQQKGTWTVQ
jgi:hypothetical protein